MWVLPAVLMETSGYLGTSPLNKDVLRSASIISGVECVVMDGVNLMPKLPADNWDYSIQVHRVCSVSTDGASEAYLYCHTNNLDCAPVTTCQPLKSIHWTLTLVWFVNIGHA